jgi:Cof subfamily protein (haloacid dehalogenase superfamily)
MHIFFTDLDGTLLNSQSQISPETRKAIDAYLQAGHKLVISSGRSLSSINGVIKSAGLPADQLIIISYNGSYVYDTAAQKALIEYRMKRQDVKHILDVCEEWNVHCHTYTDSEVICARHDPEIDFYTNSVKIPAIICEDVISMLTQDPLKVLAVSLHDKNRLIELQHYLQPWMEGKYTSFFSCDQLLEFVDIRSGKGNAVRNVCRLLNISAKDAYAAGDAGNDISMLEAAGNSIAMCNGTPEAKKAASIVTRLDHDHDGLAEFFYRLADQSAS